MTSLDSAVLLAAYCLIPFLLAVPFAFDLYCRCALEESFSLRSPPLLSRHGSVWDRIGNWYDESASYDAITLEEPVVSLCSFENPVVVSAAGKTKKTLLHPRRSLLLMLAET